MVRTAVSQPCCDLDPRRPLTPRTDKVRSVRDEPCFQTHKHGVQAQETAEQRRIPDDCEEAFSRFKVMFLPVS
jgi:hypothetical protein